MDESHRYSSRSSTKMAVGMDIDRRTDGSRKVLERRTRSRSGGRPPAVYLIYSSVWVCFCVREFVCVCVCVHVCVCHCVLVSLQNGKLCNSKYIYKFKLDFLYFYTHIRMCLCTHIHIHNRNAVMQALLLAARNMYVVKTSTSQETLLPFKIPIVG